MLEYILELINDKYTLSDLAEKLEPYVEVQDVAEALQDIIEECMYQAFEEEIEEYYDDM